MRVPRIVKILALLLVVFLAWKFSGVPASEHGPTAEAVVAGVRPTAPEEIAVHGFIVSAVPGAVLVMHHGINRGHHVQYFLYYRPVPNYDALRSAILSHGGRILRGVPGEQWYLATVLPVNGEMNVDFYPDRERNALVVFIR